MTAVHSFTWLTLIASILTTIGVSSYCVIVTRGTIRLNPSTWIIRALVASINLVSYVLVLHGDLLRALPVMVVTAGIFFVMLYSLFNGQFSKFRPVDTACLVIAILVGIFWRLSGDPIAANLLLQVVYVISFLPTISGLRKRTLRDTPYPWAINVVAYVFMVCEILLHWEANSWVALAHPLLNGLLGNGAMVYFALENSKYHLGLSKQASS